MEDNIIAMIEQVRPFLQRDGGDVEFVKYEDGVVYVRLQGHCAGCPGAQMTLKGVIQQVIQEKYPEVISVEALPFEAE